MYLEHNNQFNSDNIVLITRVDSTPLDRDIIYGSFVRPNNLKDKEEEFAIWGWKLKQDEFYEIAGKKHKDESGIGSGDIVEWEGREGAYAVIGIHNDDVTIKKVGEMVNKSSYSAKLKDLKVIQKYDKGGAVDGKTYTNWEDDVTSEIAEELEIDRGDAQGIVEAQSFKMQQSWTKGLSAKETANLIIEESSKMKEGGTIGFIPMDLEEDLSHIAKFGGTDIKGVLGILSAMIDSGLTDDDLKTPPTKTGHQYTKAKEKKAREIWAKVDPKYKGELKGNMPYSTIHRLVERADGGDKTLEKFKPFRKYQKDTMANGGTVELEEPLTMDTPTEIAVLAFHNDIESTKMSLEEFKQKMVELNGAPYESADLELAYNAMRTTGYKEGGEIQSPSATRQRDLWLEGKEQEAWELFEKGDNPYNYTFDSYKKLMDRMLVNPKMEEGREISNISVINKGGDIKIISEKSDVILPEGDTYTTDKEIIESQFGKTE